jgi:hypothetical protein
MTDMMEARMDNPVEPRDGGGRHVLWTMLAGIGIVFVAGGVAGYLSEHMVQGGGPLGTVGVVVLGVCALLIAGLAYAIWRSARKIRQGELSMARRDRMNQRTMVFSTLLGGLIALVLLVSSDVTTGDPSIFADAPIAPWVAVLLALVTGVGIPLLSWHWHNRVIDEQEADAYRSGALIAVYVYWIGAPSWWLLWRGGLVPAPDGIVIYLITIFTASIIWFWKKYR